MSEQTASFLAGAVMVLLVILIFGTIFGVVWRWVWQPLFMGGC